MNLRWLKVNFVVALAAAASLLCLLPPHVAQAKGRTATAVLEPWPGLRPLLLLPLDLGPGWNVDQAYGEALLPAAEVALEKELRSTGKLSVIVGHRYNPLLRRAILEKRITVDELALLVDKPSLQSGRTVLDKVRFDVPPGYTPATWPLIGVFHLEKIIPGAGVKPSVQVTVSGSAYEPDNPVATKNAVATLGSVSLGRTNFDRILLAATEDFRQIAGDIVEPVADIDLSGVVHAAVPAVPQPATPAQPAPDVPVTPVVPPGTEVAPPPAVATGGAGAPATAPESLPHLPAPKPPLGIVVPAIPAIQQ